MVGAEVTSLVAYVKRACAINHAVDLVSTGVSVALLPLTRFETIDVGEHPLGFEQVDLLHLLGGETALGLYVFDFHFPDPVARERCPR